MAVSIVDVCCIVNASLHLVRYNASVFENYLSTGIVLCMPPANERQRYNVTSSLIGWAHAQNYPFTIICDHDVSSLRRFYVMCSCWCLVGMLRPCIPEFHGNKTDLLMYLFVEFYFWYMYCETYNISHTLVGNEIVDHSDVVGASPVGAAPTTSSFSFFII